MNRRHLFVPVVLLALGVLACSKKQPEVAPIPEPPPAPPPPAPTPPPPPPGTADSPEAVTARLKSEVETNLIHFDYDKSDIKPEYEPVLNRKADIMRVNPAVRIRISGHADERGSDEYNLVLGNQRAQAARAYLMARGIDGSRIEITSFGEERPLEPASTEEAWAKNRRDEFLIIGGGDRLVPPR
ncbi:MAG: OmpA family protein [Gemmatimonadales bacterium]